MILGLGIDVVDVARFEEMLADPLSRVVPSTFTEGEVRYSEERGLGGPAQHLAARFAAKEAALKALDGASALAGVAPPRVSLREIEVARDPSGRPTLRLHGAAARLADEVGADRALVSLSHDGGYATAMVVLERVA